MIHALTTNPDVQAVLQKLLTDFALFIGSMLGIALMQVAAAVRNSHLGLMQKMIAERLVSFAEQKITSSGPDKADYVAQKLHEKFPNLGEEEVRHLLEAAVLNMTTQIQSAAPAAPPEGQV